MRQPMRDFAAAIALFAFFATLAAWGLVLNVL